MRNISYALVLLIALSAPAWAQNPINWEDEITSPTSILTTELNGLTNGSISAASAAQDNGSSLDMLMFCEINLGTFQSAVTGGSVSLYMLRSIDNGTTFDNDVITGGEAAGHNFVGNIALPSGGTAAKYAVIGPITIPPGQYKLQLDNNSGGQLAATGNVVACGHVNPEIQ